MLGKTLLFLLCLIVLPQLSALGQDPGKAPVAEPKKTVTPAPKEPSPQAEPFDGASVQKMAAQCVTLETEPGSIVIQMLPHAAPEAVRNFLNLAVTGALDTTTFSRTVKDFVVQGGNLSTSEKWGVELSKRASRTLPDEPSDLKACSWHGFDGPRRRGK